MGSRLQRESDRASSSWPPPITVRPVNRADCDRTRRRICSRTVRKERAMRRIHGAARRRAHRLIRHWHGEAHIVDVMEDGVL